jgi:hypothetical protein
MSLVRDSGHWAQPDRDRSARTGEQRQVIRHAPSRLARGAFACPSCDLPLLPVAPVAVSQPIECPYCREVRPARQFLRLDAIDTTRNEVYLQARLPSSL